MFKACFEGLTDGIENNLRVVRQAAVLLGCGAVFCFVKSTRLFWRCKQACDIPLRDFKFRRGLTCVLKNVSKDGHIECVHRPFMFRAFIPYTISNESELEFKLFGISTSSKVLRELKNHQDSYIKFRPLFLDENDKNVVVAEAFELMNPESININLVRQGIADCSNDNKVTTTIQSKEANETNIDVKYCTELLKYMEKQVRSAQKKRIGIWSHLPQSNVDKAVDMVVDSVKEGSGFAFRFLKSSLVKRLRRSK